MPEVQKLFPNLDGIDLEKLVRDAVAEAGQLGIDELVQQAIENQSWFRQHANTVTTGVGIVSTLAATILGLGLELPAWATAALVAAGSIGTILGVARTTNGVQPQTAVALSAVK